MPQPLSATRISSPPPCSTVTSIRVAPASTEFSSSSFTTLAGRSITSPAAILLTTLAESWSMVGMNVRSVTIRRGRRRQYIAIPKVPSRRGRSWRLRGSPPRSRRSCPSIVPSVGSGRRARGARRSCGPPTSRPPSKAAIVIRPQISTRGNWVAAASTGSTSAGARPCLAASPEVFTSSKTRMGGSCRFCAVERLATRRRSRPAGARCRRCGSARRAGACGGACCAGGGR